MKRGKITVIGSINMDLVVKVDVHPKAGELVTGKGLEYIPGGKGANQSIAAALSADAEVALIGCVGEDAHGTALLENLRAKHVNIDKVVVDAKAPTGLAQISVDRHGQNMIIYNSGANFRLLPEHIEMEERKIAESDMVITQLEIPLATVERIAQICNKHGVPLLLNPCPAMMLSDELLRRVSFLVPNEFEGAALCGINPPENIEDAIRITELLETKTPGSVLMTIGASGVLIVTEHGIKHMPAYKVDAVDATAAGDTFIGAFAGRYVNGASLEEAAQFATAAAAITVSRLGAQVSIPTRVEVEQFLREHPQH
jgi:ribokinase